ncbi:hypothetical protein DSM104443_01121 [Usitatibacter rugosus]|uniref:Uncharacterized protein n=1 Tax=Usitatibacter rugosus TaxID=2732067 RepID=A0A6M4GRW0_9PROT|nr:hypothetical protein [Usitatibacter rugosus]QJR10070.1 hypothetical protein DSM104443_01121 [Usitatibacter rugosus]
MKILGIMSFCLVIAVMLAYYGGDRREKRAQQKAEQRVRETERMQNYGRRSAQERTEAAERAMTEGPGGPAPAATEPVKKAFSKEAFDREQERRDEQTRRRVERERYEYERERQYREYEAAREEEQARRNALIKE